VHDGAWHTPPMHTSSMQSVAIAHILLSAHGMQSGPPQSTSVSFASFMPFVQWVAMHWEAAVHDMSVPQSAPVTHRMHLPMPSQTLPLLSVHGVCAGAGFVAQQPATQLETRHFVESVAQSATVVHLSMPGHDPPCPLDDAALLELDATVLLLLLLLVVVVPTPPKPPGPPSRSGWTMLGPPQEVDAPRATLKATSGRQARKRREGIATSVSDRLPACQIPRAPRREPVRSVVRTATCRQKGEVANGTGFSGAPQMAASIVLRFVVPHQFAVMLVTLAMLQLTLGH
jgi:hypothetical protein